jgi:alpha-glucosidase
MKLHISIRFFIFIVFISLFISNVYSQEYSISSPDKKIMFKISTGREITYNLYYNSKAIITNSPIAMTLDNNNILGKDSKVKNTDKREVDEEIIPVLKIKSRVIRNQYNELTINFRENFSLIFRAYNDGAAYRFITNLKNDIKVYSEKVTYNFDKNYKIFFPEEESFQSHSERLYKNINISEITSKRFSSLPALVCLDNGAKLSIAESDLDDYPGLYLSGSEDSPTKLTGKFPYYSLKDSAKNDRDVPVVKRADYMAITKGKREFPWRVFGISEKDGDLLESQLVFKLAAPLQLKETSWIKPGKVAWDWWNALNISGVDFKSGVNTETYKYFIDFAALYGIEYVILDEGWYKLGNLMDINPDIKMEELLDYAKQKNVGIILWVIWKTLDNQLVEALDKFEKWGVKGIKVDFMQRDDQWMVNYYSKIAKEAAKRHLLVDFHGAYKPTGMEKTYPNVLTREGVKGLENCKWSEDITPGHDVTLPFIRMYAGPMDYTPGAMKNASKGCFKYIFNQPMSQGTRCHQLAMYVIYESPLQMLADNPTNYLKEKECMDFLSEVPTVWDETRAIDAKVGEYVLMARKSSDNWYIGAMTDWTPRDMTFDLSFLDEGKYKMIIYQDGINADRNGCDYKKIIKEVTKSDKMTIHLAPGGGWVGNIIKVN